MATALMSQVCGDACQEKIDFSLKFVVKSLVLADDIGDGNSFSDILIVITFDNNVIKIENIEPEENGDVKPLGMGLDLQISPDDLAKKLRTRPIMLNLSRGCDDLGTVKLDISDCFIDAVKCDEFSAEACEDDLVFTKEDEETAVLTFVFRLSRAGDDAMSRIMAGMKKGFDKQQRKQTERKKKNEKKVDKDDLDADSSCFDTDSNFSCETDLCPAEEESLGRQTVFSSKCCSDIATSLDISDISRRQQTFCGGCGGFSVSGVTCDTKSMLRKTPSQITVVSPEMCKSAVNRICSECFEDLSIIPPSAPCPKCAFEQQNPCNVVSFKSEESKLLESEKIRGCLKSIFEEIFLDTKDRLVNDWNRLTKEKRKKLRKNRKNKKSSCDGSSVSTKSTNKPRCQKVRGVQHIDKSSGLTKKSPGVVLGHTICISKGPLVPKNMGWLWNIKTAGISKLRRGWKPGAVEKSVAKIMQAHLNQTVEQKPSQVKIPPTLRMQKKNGEYMIVMNSLRDDEKSDGIETSPIIFKIMKSQEAFKRSKAREILKCRGFVKTCKCTTFEECECLSKCEKNCLKCQMEKVSTELCLCDVLDFCDLNDSSDSELEMEFTPPSAAKMKNPRLRCKAPKVSCAATQYDGCDGYVPASGGAKDEVVCLRAGNRADKGHCKDGKLKQDKSSDACTQPKQKQSEILKDKSDGNCCKRCEPDQCCPTYCLPQCQPAICHRLCTNYNPMYAQCPPRPHHCARSVPFFY